MLHVELVSVHIGLGPLLLRLLLVLILHVMYHVVSTRARPASGLELHRPILLHSCEGHALGTWHRGRWQTLSLGFLLIRSDGV